RAQRPRRRHGQALLQRDVLGDLPGGVAHPRWQRLRGRVPDRAALPRRAAHDRRRGHERDPEDGDRPPAPRGVRGRLTPDQPVNAGVAVTGETVAAGETAAFVVVVVVPPVEGVVADSTSWPRAAPNGSRLVWML